LLAATEAKLEKVMAATRRQRQPLPGKARIALTIGKLLGRYKMAKHFLVEIEEGGFSYQRNRDSIEREAALDGIYVIRTNVPEPVLSAEGDSTSSLLRSSVPSAVSKVWI
jgi:hypothetical protein